MSVASARAARRICCILAIALLPSCAEEPPPPASAADAPPRIITLAPALTQMLIDLDMGENVIAVAQYDMVAPAGLPVIGHYRDVDAEKLLALRPTHVLMMVGLEGPPQRLSELAEQLDFELAVFAYPDDVAAVWRILAEGDKSVGAVLGVADEAGRLRQRSLAQLDAIREATADLDRPRVLVVFSTQPNVMASGPRTVNDELIRIAGGQNAAADAAVQAPEYGREALIAMAPDVIILMMPDAPALTDDDPRLAIFRGLPIPAVANNRMALISDPAALLPSTSLVRIAQQMLEIIHPGAVQALKEPAP